MFSNTVIYTSNLWLYLIIAVMTISKNTVISIKQLLTMEQKPKWIEENILNEVKLGIKHLKLVVQKDLLETCLRKRLYPKSDSNLVLDFSPDDVLDIRMKA